MKVQEKDVVYSNRNTYSTLNQVTEKTKYVWLVFHGIGFLSRYFLRYFADFAEEEHYFIAPQAPSKYYLNNEYKHVGASWLTRENTLLEKENVMAYLDGVWQAEKIPKNCNLIVFGYSQGVSIASRYVAYSKIKPAKLILYAGGLPEELDENSFNFLSTKTPITFIYGNQDPYLNPERMAREQAKLNTIFAGRAQLMAFEGGHELKKEIIHKVIP
ncbi:alpha/beta hydrolase [Lentiprolixibacter aurantiacus]|uniref:Esterase n=1 Tax=Lentiprolixibacter aurantiacus TaxID=2993939 RepID=A0AAE3ML49_9FLAO|nr:esterase [Lentiprolixibacter aurantiacus]MCX2719434.1 esterase [Lentiprolixibacter aurantiacus]